MANTGCRDCVSTGFHRAMKLSFAESLTVLLAGSTIHSRNNGNMERTPCPAAIGIDFGTTNSSIAMITESGSVRLAGFPAREGETSSYRSVLYLERLKTHTGFPGISSRSGPAAIEAYLDAEEKGRLIQSLKSWLPNRLFTGTEVFGRRYTIEELISRILADLRHHAEEEFRVSVRCAVAGRPVRFVGADTAEDDDYAVSRLRDAFLKAGFESVQFELEPVAAAHSYETSLDHDELILIGDFGGGTSDFSLLHVGPDIRRRGRSPHDLLGNDGIGLAGDAFDARIVRKLVSPVLGAGSQARSMNKLLPAVPAWIYSNLERWHYLSFLRTRHVGEILRVAKAQAVEPEKIRALCALIEEDLGYQLHQAVQRVKFDLSQCEATNFRFREGSLDLQIPVTRAEFEHWIAEDLQRIEECVDSLLQTSGVTRCDVDRVFLTGGTSLVPAVRRIFAHRFGEERIKTGDEFTSVARGLALRAGDFMQGS